MKNVLLVVSVKKCVFLVQSIRDASVVFGNVHFFSKVDLARNIYDFI